MLLQKSLFILKIIGTTKTMSVQMHMFLMLQQVIHIVTTVLQRSNQFTNSGGQNPSWEANSG
jgi:hypothetical protein